MSLSRRARRPRSDQQLVRRELAVERTAATSSAWVPSPTTRPWSSTTMRSESTTVDSRWAMTRSVRFSATASIASRSSCSLTPSSEAVASSSSRIGRSGQQGPRDREALAFAAGEHDAVLADRGIESGRVAVEHLAEVDRVQHGDALLVGRVGRAEREVVAQRCRRARAHPARRSRACARSSSRSIARTSTSVDAHGADRSGRRTAR